MKKSICLALGVILAAALSIAAEDLTLEQQRGIIERYMYVTGQTPPAPASLVDQAARAERPEKCGTPAILDFERNRDRLDRGLMQAMGVLPASRPVCDTSYGVPGGYTLIHYDTSGAAAPWQVRVDEDHDGVPDYVESLAMIADSCYVHEVDTLGYPRPLNDSFCREGGDARVDIYIDSMRAGMYGTTDSEADCDSATYLHQGAWITIDRDFQQIPQYRGRPLDAARVTLAHELFHTIQFNINVSEHVTWMEMTAVWMEEEIYDQINDYYLYDSLFFFNPRTSLQDTIDTYHKYQAVVFPIYLSEKYGRDIIKAVWHRSEAFDYGWNYLKAVDSMVDSASQSPAHAEYRCLCRDNNGDQCLEMDTLPIRQNLASAMAEFAVWNFFTGPYAAQAPNGIGYSEGSHYSSIPLDSLDIRREYPTCTTADPPCTIADPTLLPSPNGTAYIRLENIQAMNLDSLLSMYVVPEPDPVLRWGVTAIYQLENQPDSYVVVSDVVDTFKTWACTDSVSADCSSWICTDSTLYQGGRFLGDMLGDWTCLRCKDPVSCVCPLDSPRVCSDTTTCADSARVINLHSYRSVTLVLTPSTRIVGPFLFGNLVPVKFGIFNRSTVDENLVDLTPAVLTPYPNPAVVSEMNGQELVFRYRASTDSLSFAATTNPILELEIYTVAGELVRTMEVPFGDDRYGPRPGGGYDIGWDMKNQSGKDVASGVYLAIARLFDGGHRKLQLVEKQVKVAVIR